MANPSPQHVTPAARSRRRTTPFDRVLAPAARARAAEGSLGSRLWRSFADGLTTKAGQLMGNVDVDAIRYRLLTAGFPMGMRAVDFLALKWVMTGVFALLFFVLPVSVALIGWHVGPQWVIPITAFGAFYGFKLPDIWLSIKIRQRQFAIQLTLPDMIDLIAVAVEAGLGLHAAIQRVSNRFHNPLSQEFLRMIQEVRLGRSRTDSMRDLARRIDVPDLTTFVVSLVQAELLGLAVSNVLRVQSERLREKRAQRAREQAQKAPIKMIFPLVLFIFPALFVVILGPALMRAMQQSVF